MKVIGEASGGFSRNLWIPSHYLRDVLLTRRDILLITQVNQLHFKEFFKNSINRSIRVECDPFDRLSFSSYWDLLEFFFSFEAKTRACLKEGNWCQIIEWLDEEANRVEIAGGLSIDYDRNDFEFRKFIFDSHFQKICKKDIASDSPSDAPRFLNIERARYFHERLVSRTFSYLIDRFG